MTAANPGLRAPKHSLAPTWLPLQGERTLASHLVGHIIEFMSAAPLMLKVRQYLPQSSPTPPQIS